MPTLLQTARTPSLAVPIERTLALYYPRFVQWSAILTRGDIAVAEEIVQDLCLHLVVTRPDLSDVRDLDAYLYTSLRNMYLSHVNRASRERLRVVHVEDYDAASLAIAADGRDEVEVQNELLRICHYVRRRKYASKSASHFILHFFWGYRRSDVALIARLPISAIYNKLRDTRVELNQQRQTGWVAYVSAQSPAERETLRSALTTEAFLAKIRSLLLDAKPSECLDEEELLALYRKTSTVPVPNRKLAHLAGCSSCLRRLEQVLRLGDKEGPLDDFGGDSTRKQESRRTFHETMQAVHRRRRQLLEERPALLAIVVDGNVVASQDVESPRTALSSRIARIDATGFVEVFNERGSRLASLNVDDATQPIGQELTQKIHLSDDRWLRLDILFDEQEMHAEATYVDNAIFEAERPEPLPLPTKTKDSLWQRLAAALRVPPVSAVMGLASLTLMILAINATYRASHPETAQILAHVARNIERPTPTEALYQAIRLELPSAAQQNGDAATVIVWRDADDHTVRQLFNPHHALLATSIATGRSIAIESMVPDAAVSPAERQLLDSGAWKSDLSPDAFMDATSTRTSTGFELTTTGDSQNGVISRTLVIDREYRVVAQTVRYRTALGVSEVRMVQTALRRASRREMPDGRLPERPLLTPRSHSKGPTDLHASLLTDVVLSNLQVAVLFELYGLHADTALPLEMKTEGDRIRLSGTVPTKQMLTLIRDRLVALPHSELVDVQIRTASDAVSIRPNSSAPIQELIGAETEGPAATLVRSALHRQGIADGTMNHAEEQFVAKVLTHSQTALQHAYALERLGDILQAAGIGFLEPRRRLDWAAMVEHHSNAMDTELRALVAQLDELSPDIGRQIEGDVEPINDPGDYSRTSSLIRGRAQRLNKHVMELFGAGSTRLNQEDIPTAMEQLRNDLPTKSVEETMRFAARLERERYPSTVASGVSHLP